MPRVLLKSLTFDQPPFRKLGGVRIDFAPRITLIAGHNGIGKSTIMGQAYEAPSIKATSTALIRRF
jgi:predicted ATPase